MKSQNPSNLPMGQYPEQPKDCRTRTGQRLSPLDSQCEQPACYETAPLSQRSDCLSCCDGDETINEVDHSQEDSNFCTQLSLAQAVHLQQLLRKEFSQWSEGLDYTAPPVDRLPPRKRFRTSQWESGLPRGEDEDVSDEELVVVYYSTGKQGFYHLACPFYAHAPEKYQQCLIKEGLDSIEKVINHLFRNHNRPLYCPSCRKTFETLVERDGHILENVCKRNNEKLLEGLTESQKSGLIDKDQYDLGETTRWCLIWCTVLPDSEEPGSPYLDRGDGLKISMIRDFWAVAGQQFVCNFLKGQGAHTDQNCTVHESSYQKALESLIKWAMDDLTVCLPTPDLA
ncbi:hypothetical protein FOPG_19411 [Fusarium oxysporum f. sp. conglutinans race 2 54008]|uniref:C2H2-type domain-containing protein n=1 Tax=Fusarium oxysporum f. sp. conglutinans race 2 54008 TaxID=1089457 RepID=X0GL69_FUSOX|nr:hypothetical protein FOPG_19411 [Fusarium oxysporum f. sp. conglutinans race 2 54008]KAI8416157.1 hypothetical protein FOFC_02466 [Fusarium oxysporum]